MEGVKQVAADFQNPAVAVGKRRSQSLSQRYQADKPYLLAEMVITYMFALAVDLTDVG